MKSTEFTGIILLAVSILIIIFNKL
jgi:hypothetical protein